MEPRIQNYRPGAQTCSLLSQGGMRGGSESNQKRLSKVTQLHSSGSREDTLGYSCPLAPLLSAVVSTQGAFVPQGAFSNI